MNAVKELLQKAKALFNSEPAPPTADPVTTETKLATYKLKDGGEISISGDTIEIGATVTIDGAQAPSGEYELEDGKIITVDADGKVSLVVTPEAVTQPEFEAPETQNLGTPTLEERTNKLEEKISAIESKVGAFETNDEAKLQELRAKISKQDEVIKGLFEMAEKLVELPTADPKTLTGNRKEMFDRRNAKEERLQRIAKAIREIKTIN